jgi:hypoxanthine phosphoribosyltransferase
MRAAPIERVLLTEEQIRLRVRDLAAQINADYGARDLLLVTVLKGGLYFLADLSRSLTIPAAIDFMAISSYRAGPKRSGAVRLIKDLDEDLTGRHVLLVEDIIDTGLTMSYLLRTLRARDPADLAICTLLDKTTRRIVDDLPIRYRGFEAPDAFLVGYGLDFREQYRNLPYIGILQPELIATPAQG